MLVKYSSFILTSLIGLRLGWSRRTAALARRVYFVALAAFGHRLLNNLDVVRYVEGVLIFINEIRVRE